MNEQQIKAQQMAAARRQFTQAFATGQVGAIDRFSNKITDGANVIYKVPYDLQFTVQAITPVLDPRMPPGYIDIVLTTSTRVRVPANQQNMNMMVMGDTSAKPAAATLPDPSPDSGDSPAGIREGAAPLSLVRDERGDDARDLGSGGDGKPPVSDDPF